MKICLLIGGEGSNACAIIKAIQGGELKATCTGVISHNKLANGLKNAQALGVNTLAVDCQDFLERDAFEAALIAAIETQSPDVIVLAGFMRILSANFVDRFPNKILNIHPSLLPKYPGLNTYQRALEAGDRYHGATVHLVTQVCDGGPILLQATIPIMPEDTPETLKQRLKPLEHQLYIDALDLIQKNTDFTKTSQLEVQNLQSDLYA